MSRERMETRIGRMSREGKEMLDVDVIEGGAGVGVPVPGESADWGGDAIVTFLANWPLLQVLTDGERFGVTSNEEVC